MGLCEGCHQTVTACNSEYIKSHGEHVIHGCVMQKMNHIIRITLFFFFKKKFFLSSWVVVALTFNPSTEGEAVGSEFETCLVYRVNFRTARATERNPVSKTKTKTSNSF